MSGGSETTVSTSTIPSVPAPSSSSNVAPLPIAPMAPTLVSSDDPMRTEIISFDQKSETGYVGLANQGATCYLNSLLQCLYMTPEFRIALLTWKYIPSLQHQNNLGYDYSLLNLSADESLDGDNDPDHCIPYQLQCLFARLCLSQRGSVSTKPLTKSFYWDDGQAFQQHDVQELLRVLLDAVSRTFEQIGQNNFINQFCAGSLSDYITCEECHNTRSKIDIFLDLSLVIENKNTLDQALKNFVEPEILTENNKVHCDICSKKCDAKKGLKFHELPPILFIQLKRFFYDWQADRRVKLSHQVTFDNELDMTPYLDNSTNEDSKKNNIYTLYGIIIHSGGALGGHYYAYVKSLVDNKWYSFNDSVVTELDIKKFDDAYGGGNFGTGYVLLYRRKDLPLPSNFNNVPSHLQQLVQKEDNIIHEKWLAYQKHLRTIRLTIHKYNDKEDEIKFLELDSGEVTYQQLLIEILKIYNLNNDNYIKENYRVRKYYPEYNFPTEVIDTNNEIEVIEKLNFSKNNTHLLLECKKPSDPPFSNVNPYDILIKCFLVDEKNVEKVVEHGFIQSATLTAQELPPGIILPIVIDKSIPLKWCKEKIFKELKLQNVLPEKWKSPEKLNIIKLGYNSCRLLDDDIRNLSDYNVSLGNIIYIERQLDDHEIDDNALQILIQQKLNDKKIPITSDNKNPTSDNQERNDDNKEQEIKEDDYDKWLKKAKDSLKSALVQLYEEHRLKITLQFNEPLPVDNDQTKLQNLLMDPLIRSSDKTAQRQRIDFNHNIRFNKDRSLGDLKEAIAVRLNLKMNEFRLRKHTGGIEYKDLEKSIHSHGIMDGGVVYVERGIPTGPNEICINFSLYDPTKALTDPLKKKKTLLQNLFEYPFHKDILIKDLKIKIVDVINNVFPAVNGMTLTQFISQSRNEKMIVSQSQPTLQSRKLPDYKVSEIDEMAKTIHQSASYDSDLSGVSGSPIPIPIETFHQDNTIPRSFSNTSLSTPSSENESTHETNLYTISERESIKSNASLSMLSDNIDDINADNEILLNIFGIKHVRIRKIVGAGVKEMLFDDISLGKNISAREDVRLAIEKIPIDEYFTKSHLSFWMYKYRADIGQHGKLSQKREMVIDKNNTILDLKLKINSMYKVDIEKILLVKGYSSTTMTAQSASRLKWNEEMCINDWIVSKPPLYLHNGDVLVWQDTSIKPSTELVNERKAKMRTLEKNPKFRGGDGVGTTFAQRYEPGPLQILTPEEYLVKQKKEQEAREEKELQKKLKNETAENSNENINKEKEVIKTEKPKDEFDLPINTESNNTTKRKTSF